MNLDERYTLVETKTGGLMLDLVSGALLELNESGKAIWQLALAGHTEEAIAAALVTRHALELETARKHVRDTLRTSPAGAMSQRPCFSSPSSAVKHDAESKRGRHSQSTEPSRATSAAVCRSATTA